MRGAVVIGEVEKDDGAESAYLEVHNVDIPLSELSVRGASVDAIEYTGRVRYRFAGDNEVACKTYRSYVCHALVNPDGSDDYKIQGMCAQAVLDAVIAHQIAEPDHRIVWRMPMVVGCLTSQNEDDTNKTRRATARARLAFVPKDAILVRSESVREIA